MLNPNEIDPKHLPSMQAAILKHRSVVDEHLVSKLYKSAKVFFVEYKEVAVAKTWTSRIVAQDGTVLVTCTDVDTGLFVQLSGVPEKGTQAAMVTFGQKFCQEYKDTMRQNIATKIW